MPRPKTPPFSLTRQLIRQSWNKYNLFNLARKQTPSITNKTMYQQKWEAKRETRAYHGAHLAERQFKAGWDRRLVGVAGEQAQDKRRTPLASQTFASMEKRLDIALYRAMFASSARQAKQMVVHGKVRVNGVLARQPGLVLKAGDLFEVEPAAVIMNVSPSRGQQLEATEEETAEPTEGEGEAATPTISKVTAKAQAWEEIGADSFIPKPFMSAFAFVPAYLQVDFETCSAVYLRDPVARPGHTEVPSPFPAPVHGLAYSMYERGR
ncbi:hypothetical protein BCR37DRAFT_123560 [Protomyces lactucae-debilis]|uniref:RNA-binding S4 domain-containing protein n=1 Tax=Protomyces lactucae-debilis TaxID=2754530 RepID=A0A1Y2FU00_PROLT|nr:uncharacterized protein BCR37DRAFT_123560 [Protomyces lactucae-debilis]ORY86774.1 hypothetical protein BCR37DRAFT_123560 [Protomyces lactucae-debilis]